MGERLQRLRLARGLSQSQLASAAGVPPGTLKNWEQGRRTMLIDAAARLAVALGCTVGQLAGTEPLPAEGEAGEKPRKGKK
jgi:transcriptional regulator with XRE-family HTH domain